MSASARDRGELALVLHSHMPYVEGFGTWPFGEEWLFEAMASAYLPLIERCGRWPMTGSDPVLTVGVTPVLADQLALPEVGERFLRFMHETRADCHRLDSEGLERAGQREAAAVLRRSAHDYEHAATAFESLGRDLPGALRRLRDTGAIELWTSAATHAVLPLIATECALRLQLETGIDSHHSRFGRWSGGFWLPECAFRQGLEEQLAVAGVRAFCVDQTNHGDALDQLEPVACDGGAVAVPIDWRTISLVWNEHGYPADPVYRDYHAPTLNGLRPFANSGKPYDYDAASKRAREHALHFLEAVRARLDGYRAARGGRGLLVCALDTELLGHWWYEGPQWLEAVVEQAPAAGVALTTIPEALERHEPKRREMHESSWGTGKDLRTWDSPSVAQLVWPVRRAELALAAAAGSAGSNRVAARALERAARELLALESSDWQFMATRRLAADYPDQRVNGHAEEFDQALASVRNLEDFRAMPGERIEPRLRGLAPLLRVSTLMEPSSGWGRSASNGSEP